MALTHAAARDEVDYAIPGQISVPGTVLRAAKRLKLLHKWSDVASLRCPLAPDTAGLIDRAAKPGPERDVVVG